MTLRFSALTVILTATLMTVILPTSLAGGPIQPPVEVDTLYVGEIGWGPVHADPVRAYDTRSQELIFNVYDRLISFGSPVANNYGVWDVEEQHWEFEPALSLNVPVRQEVIMVVPDSGINPDNPVCYWFEPIPPDGFWYHIEGWVDNNPDWILGPCDVLYIGVYSAPFGTVQQALAVRTWHVLEYVPGMQLLLHHYYYDFNIRLLDSTGGPIYFFENTGAPVDTFDIFDAEYSFKRGLVQDQYGSPMWMFYKPFFDQMNSDWWNRGNPDDAWVLSLLIKNAVEVLTQDVLRINVGIPFPDGPINKAFLQIMCGTGASIVSQQWCIGKGCWNGDLFSDSNQNGIPDWFEPFPIGWRHVAASPIDAVTPANYAGTGPYHVTVADQMFGLVVMTRNPGHWRGWPAYQKKAYLDTIDIEYIQNWNTMRTMFEACQLDIIEVPRSQMRLLVDPFGQPLNPAIKTIKNITPSLMLDGVFFTFGIDPESPAIYTGRFPEGIPPDFFNNTDCRKAIAWAFNHTKYLGADAWQHEATCRDTPDIAGLVPDYYTWGPDPPYFYDYNKDQLRYALQRAMFTQDQITQSVWDWSGFRFDILYNAGNEERRIACEMLRDTFEEINVEFGKSFQINVQSLDWPTFINWMEQRAMPVFVTGWQSDYADADNFKRSFMHTQGFFRYYQGYSNATCFTTDPLIDLAVKTPDGPERANIYADLDDIYLADLPSFPIAQPIGRKWLKYWVKGWYYNALCGGSLQAFQGTCDYYYKMYKEQSCWADITSATAGVPDGVCDMRDISYILGHFNGKAPDPERSPAYDPKWAPGTYGCAGCDALGDRKVDMRDVSFACMHFRHTVQP